MVKKFPDFERGESASETGRTHIPPRLFKEAVRLNRQKDKIKQLLSEITPPNAKKKSAEIEDILIDYIPSVEKLMTRMKKASSTVKELKKGNRRTGTGTRWQQGQRPAAVGACKKVAGV